MLGRLSALPKCAVAVRKLSMFDTLLKDPKIKEKAAEMMKDPNAMQNAMASFTNVMKDGGGGLTGMLMRNSPLKGAIEKMGGMENVEKMMKDPKMMEMVQNMMKNPEMMAKAQDAMSEAMKKSSDELPAKKN